MNPRLTLLEILQPTNVPEFNPDIGRVYKYNEKSGRPLLDIKALRKAQGLPDGQKKCKACLKIKKLEMFPVENTLKDGRANTCKQCASIRRTQLRRAKMGAKK